jgi:undecaprenyl diphosphate synthase
MVIDLDPAQLPRHVAIVMDGNGRWAQKRGLARLDGHRAGAEAVRTVIRASRRLGIPYLTLYTFSTENWLRPKGEVEGLMRLLERLLQSEIDELKQNGVRLNAIGDLDRLPPGARRFLDKALAFTADGRELVVTLCLSYGGRAEIVQACRRAMIEAQAGRLSAEDLDEPAFARLLYTHDLPDPDLMIRTGGEQRISNYLPWQLAYAELLFASVHWPDFGEAQYLEAIEEYARRQRRFGRTGEQVAS